MNWFSIFAIKLLSNMNKTKTHTLIVRGVSKSAKNWLKDRAKKNRTSTNSLILTAIDLYMLEKYVNQSN